jgi:hypothetical protein
MSSRVDEVACRASWNSNVFDRRSETQIFVDPAAFSGSNPNNPVTCDCLVLAVGRVLSPTSVISVDQNLAVGLGTALVVSRMLKPTSTMRNPSFAIRRRILARVAPRAMRTPIYESTGANRRGC